MTASDQGGASELFFRKDDSSRKGRRRGPRPDLAKRIAPKGEPEAPLDHINQELYKGNAGLAVRNRTLALLRQLDEISLQALKTEEIAGKITSAIAVALGYDLVALAVVHQHKKENTLQWVGVSSSIEWITKAIEAHHSNTIKESLDSSPLARYLLRAEGATFVDDPKEVYPMKLMEALEEADQSPNVEEVKHTMVYSLRFGEKVLGVLTLSSSRSLKDLSRYEQEAVSGITGLVALAVYKAELYEDLQRTSEELASANTQLRNLDKAKSEFLSIASHQLYTPLTALRGYVSMMREGDFGQIPEKQKAVLDILDKSVIRLVDLIKGLLDISRIERGKLELNLQSISLVDMAKELVQDLMPNAMTKGLEFEFHPGKDVSNVVADKDRLRQVMLNFVDNAIKYTLKGRIDVSVEQDGSTVIFSVTDTGRGMSKEDVQRLFHKFVRVGGSSRFHTEGTGLGLYVAQQIVQEHNGEVSAASPGEGKGSTFTMKIPAEGTPNSLKVGQKTVEIKAAEDEATK